MTEHKPDSCRIGVTMTVLTRGLGAALIFIVALNVANVVGRYVFGRTLQWADEIQVYILVWMVFMGTVLTAWHRRHLRMDLLVNLLPPHIAQGLRFLESCVVAAICAFAAWHSVRYAWNILLLGHLSEGAGIPMWIPHAAIGTGFCLVVVVSLWAALSSTESPR